MNVQGLTGNRHWSFVRTRSIPLTRTFTKEATSSEIYYFCIKYAQYTNDGWQEVHVGAHMVRNCMNCLMGVTGT